MDDESPTDEERTAKGGAEKLGRDWMPPIWDMSQERMFMENLLNKRFNFFLVFVALVVAGATKSEPLLAVAILGMGSVVTFLLAMVLERTQVKLDCILDDFLLKDPTHPAAIIDTQVAQLHTKQTSEGGIRRLAELSGGKSRRRIIGIVVPRVCVLALVVGTMAACALRTFG